MSDILWPAGFVPGFTDNHVSNEVIVAGLTAAEIWPFLALPSRWPEYDANAADVEIHDGKGPELSLGDSFFSAPSASRCPPVWWNAFPRFRASPPASPGTAAQASRARPTGWTCIAPG